MHAGDSGQCRGRSDRPVVARQVGDGAACRPHQSHTRRVVPHVATEGDGAPEHTGGGVRYGGDQRLPLSIMLANESKQFEKGQDNRTPNAASHPTIYERNFEYDLGANSETQSIPVGVSLAVFGEAGGYQLWLD